MERFFYIALYFIESVKFVYGYESIINKKLNNRWLFLLASLPYILVATLAPMEMQGQLTIIIYVEMIFLTIFLGSGRIVENFKHTIILEIFLNAVDGIVEIIVEITNLYMPNNIYHTVAMNLFKMTAVMILFGVRQFVVLHRGPAFKRSKSVTYLAAVMLSVIILENCVLHIVKDKIVDQTFQIAIPWIIILSYFCVIILALMVMYIDHSNKELNKKIQAEQELFQMKENYYAMLLEKEEQTRKYRHDVMNHYIVLQKLQEEKKESEAKEYFEEMIGELREIQGKNIFIGNPIVEIIVNYYIGKLPKETQISIEGVISKTIDATDKQISTIFGNLMQNAVEAIEKCKGDKKIWIRIEQGTEFIRVTIQNTMNGNVEIKKGAIIRTSKNDRVNHGYGIINVGEVLDQIGGMIRLSSEKNMFCVEVVLRLVTEKITIQ